MQCKDTPQDGLSLIFVLQNKMSVMDNDGVSLSFDFKFPFQNKIAGCSVVVQ